MKIMIGESGCKHGRDLIMLMPYPGQEPANCEENLAKLEPSVLHKFSTEDDYPNPILSPFF